MSLLTAGKNFANRLGRGAKTSLAAVGFVTVAGLSADAWSTRKFVQEEAKEKKRVLMLPFYKLKLVNKQDKVAWLQSKGSDDAVEEMEVQELVDLIHEASSDPQVVAIYGEFGHGRQLSAGMADTEEIRTALRVFRESHRVHREPNLSHEPYLERNKKEKKRLFAYADSFEGLGPENKDYYLASMFTHIHLQEKGMLGLNGMSTSVPFLRDSLKKYGVQCHVYKHGDYKNAPNSLTEAGFTKAHKENVKNYLKAINFGLTDDIAVSRKLPFSWDAWQIIHDSGSLTSNAAQKIGLIDYASKRSPLDDLLALQQTKDEKEKTRIKSQWGAATDLESFRADEKVSLSEYKSIVAQRRTMEHRKWLIYSRLRDACKKYPMVKDALETVGLAAAPPNLNIAEVSYLVLCYSTVNLFSSCAAFNISWHLPSGCIYKGKGRCHFRKSCTSTY